MLDAERFAERRRWSNGPRPRPPPPGRRRTATRCTDHAVVEGQPRALQPATAGMTPMPTTTRSASRRDPSARWTTAGRARPGAQVIVHPDAGTQGHAVGPVQLGARLPIWSPSTRPSGVGAPRPPSPGAPRPWQVAATSDPMNPAPMTTSRAPSPAAQQSDADGQAVVERAQDADPGHGRRCRAGAAARPRWRRSARRSGAPAVVAVEGPGLGVERPGPPPETELEPERVELVRARGGGCARRPRCRPATAWTAAAGRRARWRSSPTMIDRAGVALVADLLGRPQAGQRGAHDDDGGVGGEGLSSWGVIVGRGRRHREQGRRPGRAQRPNMVIHCSGVRRRNT